MRKNSQSTTSLVYTDEPRSLSTTRGKWLSHWPIQGRRSLGSDDPLPARLPSLYTTANYNAKLTNTILLSSRLHRCSNLGLYHQLLGDLTQTSGFAHGPQWRTSIPRLLRCQILDPSHSANRPLISKSSKTQGRYNRSLYVDHLKTTPLLWVHIDKCGASLVTLFVAVGGRPVAVAA